MATCCFSLFRIAEGSPKPFDHRDIYQQMQIIPLEGLSKGQYTAKSVAGDAMPPWIFRQDWRLFESEAKNNEQLGEALGINKKARSNYLELNPSTTVITGKWYCPFLFLREGRNLIYQMQRTMFYEVTLEQFWEEANSATEKKRILLEGKETMHEVEESNDGFVWFKKTQDLNEETIGLLKGKEIMLEETGILLARDLNEGRIGLNLALWERIKWEETREGWEEGTCSTSEEMKFGGYVLVERFSFKRQDGSVALALDFVNTSKIRS